MLIKKSQLAGYGIDRAGVGGVLPFITKSMLEKLKENLNLFKANASESCDRAKKAYENMKNAKDNKFFTDSKNTFEQHSERALYYLENAMKIELPGTQEARRTEAEIHSIREMRKNRDGVQKEFLKRMGAHA